MKNTVFFIGVLFILAPHVCTASRSEPVHIQVGAREHHAMTILIVAQQNNQELTDIAQTIKKDLAFSGQFSPVIKTVNTTITPAMIKQLFRDTNVLLALFLTNNDATHIEWRLYDTMSARMIKGKRYSKRGSSLIGWAHNMSDMIWPELTGQEGFFSTKIAYCKEQVGEKVTDRYKNIYVADYDGSNAERLVGNRAINLAPRWNNDPENPLLFYSECTASNIRLMVSNMEKKRWITSDFDGINMLPAFSGDGKKVVYCASRGNGNCDLYYYEKDQFKRLTREGNNIAPTLSADGTYFFFCSDAQTETPQIYRYDIKTDTAQRITDDGFCSSPAYCPKNQLLAYTKSVNGIAQIFIYNTTTGQHRQITDDPGNKEECSWSACGNYLLYAVHSGAHSQIAVLNLLTHTQQFITAREERCSYPSWSGKYTVFPVIH